MNKERRKSNKDMGEGENTPRVIFENDKFAAVEIVPLPQPAGEIGEFNTEPEPAEEAEELPTVPDSMELTLTLTPEQAEAFEGLVKTAREVYEQILEVFRTLAKAVGTTAIDFANAIRKTAYNAMDAMLYIANDNPKWWHLYKHAKKERTRKKYRRRLMQQLLSKLRAAHEQEA